MNPGAESRSGEQRIGAAFRRSLLVIVVLVALAGLGWWLMRPADIPHPIEEAEIAAPVARQAEPGPLGPPPLPFTDITEQAGIDFVHVNGAYGDKLMPETMGSGVAFFDYDRDGDPDLLFVNSSYWPERAEGRRTSAHLYRNDDGGRHFVDVTESVGLAENLYGMGAAVGDYDNDGWPDLYLTTLGENRLYRNVQGRFVDVSAEAGVAGNAEDWSTGASFLDIDNDGDLDLFVANYVTWSPQIDQEIGFQLAGLGRSYGAPNHHEGALSRLYRNDGEGLFTEISQASGVAQVDPGSGRAAGKALGVVALDMDGDRWVDLLIANDTTRNFYLHNLGDGRFEEIGMLEGMAYDREGKATGGMGIDVAHFRNDAELGVAIGNFANEMTSLFVTLDGRGPMVDEAVLEGIGPDSRLALTFAVLFFDADLDGRLDLFQANGHLENDINRVQPSQTYAQPAYLFWNCGEACPQRFVRVRGSGGLDQPMVGRGAAYADIDGDGDLDLAIAQNGRPGRLLRNDQDTGHHWLRVRLIGTKANRDALGAWLELTAGGVTQRRQVSPTRGYLSQVELPVTFGLGEATAVERLDVVWPGGQRQRVIVDPVDRLIEVTQE